MPMDQEWLAERNALKAQLDAENPDGCVYTISLRNPARNLFGGCVAQVTTRIAAEQIINQTARIATSQEIEEFLQRGKMSAAKMGPEEQRRRPGTSNVILVPDAGANK